MNFIQRVQREGVLHMTDIVYHLFDGFFANENLTPVIVDDPSVVVDDIDEDESPSGNQTKPKCVVCGGPNFSLRSERCICCRVL